MARQTDAQFFRADRPRQHAVRVGAERLFDHIEASVASARIEVNSVPTKKALRDYTSVKSNGHNEYAPVGHSFSNLQRLAYLSLDIAGFIHRTC